MVISGVTSVKDVKPILVDSSGRPYVLLDDGSGNTMPAGDSISRPLFVKITDGSQVFEIDGGNRGEVTVHRVRPDAVNELACMDTVVRAGFQKITDGSDIAIIETDDNDIAKDQKTLAVINLNYRYDSTNSKWVRQTPSSPIWLWNANMNVRWGAKTGDWSRNENVAYEGGTVLYNFVSPAVNDEVGLGCFYVSEAGDYTLRFVYAKGDNFGYYGWIIDGVAQTNVDGYAAGESYDNLGTVTLSSLTKGLHFIALAVPGKNGSSTNYRLAIQAVSIEKA